MGKQIMIIGCGPGAPELMTIKGKKAIKNADAVIGSKRLIKDFVKKNALDSPEATRSPKRRQGAVL